MTDDETADALFVRTRERIKADPSRAESDPLSFQKRGFNMVATHKSNAAAAIRALTIHASWKRFRRTSARMRVCTVLTNQGAYLTQ